MQKNNISKKSNQGEITYQCDISVSKKFRESPQHKT